MSLILCILWLSGLDYVSHDDILPYIISDPFSKAINHELFDKFLTPEPGKGMWKSLTNDDDDDELYRSML
jgi:hypothetical protein